MVQEPFIAYFSQVVEVVVSLAIGLILDHSQISNPTLEMFIPRCEGVPRGSH